MLKHLSEIDTIGEIRQSSRHPLGKTYVWVLVEGITDQKLYAKLLDNSHCKVEIVHGGGVQKLRETMLVLIQESDKLIGIRDADFLHLEHQQESINGLFLTDAHDAEMMLFACDAVFQHLLAEYLPNATKQFEVLRERLLNSLAFVSSIRWLNHAEDLTLKLEDIGLADFYDAVNLALDKERCIQNVETRSRNKKRNIHAAEIEAKIQGVQNYYNLCNGHDVVKAFALHLTAKNKKGIKDEEVARALRIAYRKEDFATTALFASLRNWEMRTGYKLFRPS
ncbi:MAG: hypothetical protein PHI11_11185 [Gallionella sp.]|nr:hypothetical protein [Gallionella sp.]